MANQVLTASGTMIIRHPRISMGAFVFVLVFGLVAQNALIAQQGRHPAPLVATRAQSLDEVLSRNQQQIRVVEQTSVAVPTKRVSGLTVDPPGQLEVMPSPERTASIPEDRGFDRGFAVPPVAPVPSAARNGVQEQAQPQTGSRVTKSDRVDRADRADDKSRSVRLVTDLQTELARLGHYDATVDGLMGPKTRAAIRAYEKSVGLEPSGKPSPVLLARMRQEGSGPDAAASNAPVPPSPVPLSSLSVPAATAERATRPGRDASLDEPVTADLVRRIQSGLNNAAYASVRVDGVAGEKTRDAIRRFQIDYRLPVNGQPSALVLEKLVEVGAL